MPIGPGKNTSADFARTEIELADLTNKVNKLATAQSAGTGTGATAQIGICSPNFIISTVQGKKGERDIMCFDPIPSAATQLEIVIGQTADGTTKAKVLTKIVDVDDLAAAAHHLEVEFPHDLVYNTQYGLIKIKAFNINGTVIAVNPGTNPWNGTQYTYITTWTTGPALGVPSAPDCRLDPTGANGLIIANTFLDADGDIGAVSFRIYADPTKTKTFDQQQAIRAIGYFNPVLGGVVDPKTIHVPATIQDTTQKFIDIQGQFVLGQTVQWTQNALAHGTGRSLSATSNCTFIAGNVNTDATAFANMCAGCTLSFSAIDARQTLVTVRFTQPAVPFAIKKDRLDRSDDNGVTFNPEFPADRPIASGTVSSGLQTQTYIVKTKVANNHKWRMFFLARPGLSGTSPTFNSNGVADPTGDPATANWIFGPSSASSANAGLQIIINSKHLKLHWIAPQHLTSGTDAVPQSVMQYGMQMVSGDGGTWVSLDSPPPYPTFFGGGLTSPGYEHILTAPVNKFGHGWLKTELPAAFLNTGFKVALRPYNLVNAVVTAGPWCNYSPAFTVAGDPVADAAAPIQPPAPAITSLIEGVRVDAIVPTTGGNSITKWQIAMSSINFAPTDSDPPTEGGDPVFVFVENATGTKKFRIPGLATGTIRYFWTRCKNASNPTSGGPGAQGWSPWSPSANVNGTLSIITALTPGAPVLGSGVGDPNAVPGYFTIGAVNNSSPIPGDVEPAHVWLDNSNSSNVLVVVEVILPTDPNAWSLTGILFEVYKASNQVLRFKTAISPALTNVFTFGAFAGFAAIRYRLQNQYRDTSGTDAGSGLSPWTNYMQGQGVAAPLTYNPGANPPPQTDFNSIASRPIPFISPL